MLDISVKAGNVTALSARGGLNDRNQHFQCSSRMKLIFPNKKTDRISIGFRILIKRSLSEVKRSLSGVEVPL